MTLQALIFDVDGTLAETEEAHREAFNRAFRDAGLDWHWDVECYRVLLAVSGGRERILHHVAGLDRPPAAPAHLEAWAAELHRAKTLHYARLLAAGHIALRPGVARLLHEARAHGIRLAIATTTTYENVIALLEATLGRDAPGWFDAIGAAAQAPVKKPHPSVYLWVLERLGLPASACLAIEDSANGVRAAAAAGLRVLVTESRYSAGEDFTGALAVVPDLGTPLASRRDTGGSAQARGVVDVGRLRCWHADARELAHECSIHGTE